MVKLRELVSEYTELAANRRQNEAISPNCLLFCQTFGIS